MHKQLNLLTILVMMTGLTALSEAGPGGFVHCAALSSPVLTSCTCDDTHTGPTAIQDAVNHAEQGDTVCIGTGTYNEQVIITESITLQGNDYLHTTIQPSSVTANTTNLATNVPVAAIILVDGATRVTIKDMTIDGGLVGNTSSCGPDFVGIFYRASS